MVGAAGFEPTAFRTRTERATKLRYAPTNLLYYNLFFISNLFLFSIGKLNFLYTYHNVGQYKIKPKKQEFY